MTIEQFKFKPSYIQGVSEEATQTIGKNSYVKLQKEGNFTRVIKVLHTNIVYNVLFNTDENLAKALNTIGKRK